MIYRFTYDATGNFHSAGTFETTLLVIASSEEEAEDEAVTCLDSFDEVKDWSIKPQGFVAADEDESTKYAKKGPFAVFDPSVLPPPVLPPRR